MEVIEDLAFVLPVQVLCDLLGVPHSDGLLFRSLADRLLGFQGRNRPELAVAPRRTGGDPRAAGVPGRADGAPRATARSTRTACSGG